MGGEKEREKEAGMVRHLPVEEAQWAALNWQGSDEPHYGYGTPDPEKCLVSSYLALQTGSSSSCKGALEV